MPGRHAPGCEDDALPDTRRGVREAVWRIPFRVSARRH